MLVAGALGVTAPSAASADVFINESNPCLGTTDPAPFADRDEVSEAHVANVDCTFAAGIFLGSIEDGERVLRPNDDVSRGAMATLTVRALRHAGYVLPTDAPDAFPDDDGTIHEENINIAAQLSIVGGFADGTFRANLPVSRAQQMSYLVRAAEAAFGSTFPNDAPNPYTDVAATNVHLSSIVTASTVLGLTSGRGDGTFDPAGMTTRQQMTSYVTRLVDLVLLDTSGSPQDPGSGPVLADEVVTLD